MVVYVANETPGVMLLVYKPCTAISSLINGYPKVLKPHSNNQIKYINGINDLYLKITTQQTKQKISCAKPHKEKNL